MSPTEEAPDEFERQVRVMLEDSVTRIEGRIRSRLNQARHAAIEESQRRPVFWRRFALMPAAGAVAAAVMVAFVLWPHSPQRDLPLVEAGHATVEDLDLLADGDGLDLITDETDGGVFYEWAVEQSDAGETSS
jgi:hypothetical protein